MIAERSSSQCDITTYLLDLTDIILYRVSIDTKKGHVILFIAQSEHCSGSLLLIYFIPQFLSLQLCIGCSTPEPELSLAEINEGIPASVDDTDINM